MRTYLIYDDRGKPTFRTEKEIREMARIAARAQATALATRERQKAKSEHRTRYEREKDFNYGRDLPGEPVTSREEITPGLVVRFAKLALIAANVRSVRHFASLTEAVACGIDRLEIYKGAPAEAGW
jgi:hypothetical protein